MHSQHIHLGDILGKQRWTTVALYYYCIQPSGGIRLAGQRQPKYRVNYRGMQHITKACTQAEPLITHLLWPYNYSQWHVPNLRDTTCLHNWCCFSFRPSCLHCLGKKNILVLQTAAVFNNKYLKADIEEKRIYCIFKAAAPLLSPVSLCVA